MHYTNWISQKYSSAKKSGFLAFLNIISVLGIAIGVAALIVVISVMTGFGNNLREKIIGTSPHVMIEKETGIRDYNKIRQQVNAIEGVVNSSAYIQGNVFLESSNHALGLVVRGVQPDIENQITKIDEYLVKGKLTDLKEETILIGHELARYFGFTVGDTLTIIAPGSGIAGEGWRYEFKIAGIFKTGMVDYDMNLSLVNLKTAQKIFSLDEGVVTGIGVRLKDPYLAQEIQKKIYAALGFSFIVKSWIDINRNLFEALFLEKWGLFIILILMVLVASFNIISTLIVTVTSKIHDIGILQSIGVPKRAIKKIFVNQGMHIGLIGTCWGLLSGVILCYALKTFIKVPPDIYSIDHVPVEIQLTDVLAIVTASLVISFLATIYPASRAPPPLPRWGG